MQSELQIVVDPEPPRLGRRVRLSLERGGEAVADDTQVRWTMRRRDDPQEHWPHTEQGRPRIEIAKWSREDHATYYADIEGGRAARTVPASIRVALSGGGFRASLFGLGALLYLVDTDAAYRIEDVASVSGGSITNAFICDRCDLTQTTKGDFWEVCAEMARLSTRARLLPRRRIPTAVPLIAFFCVWATALSAIGVWVGWPWALGVVAASLLLFPLRGFLLFEPVLRFRFGLHASLGEHFRRVSHVFCSTDVVVGEPFYFLATRFGGFFWTRRRGACATRYSMAKAVRASAAYPFAFLPKRVPLKAEFEWGEEPGRREKQYKSRHAYCADGGVSNNLGTQWFDENDPNDMPYRVMSKFNKGAWQPGREFLELTIDASGPLRALGRHLLWFPALGELRSLRRAMGLLYENTLEPRRGGAAWELSEINNAGYAQFAAEGRFIGYLMRRGAHRRTLIPLDPELPFEAGADRPGRYLLENPDPLPGLTVISELEAVGMTSETVAELLAGARQIPTTLFKLSRPETVSTILGGYVATLINCERYEHLGIPESLAETITRIRTLV